MRFMVIRKADPQTEAGVMPSAELLDAMQSYNEEMVRAGVMLAGDGLRPSRDGAKVKFHRGKPTIVDEPFTEAKELVAGYSIIQVSSREEALDWLRKWPALDGDGEVELELRQLYEAEDFGAGAAWRHEELLEQLRERGS
jgi:hypothetical protein